MVGDTKLKVRVAGILKSSRGFLFDKSDEGYLFLLGGKVMAGESTREAMVRELREEMGINISELYLRAVVENFYTTSSGKVHEFCFVYEIGELFDAVVPTNCVEVTADKIIDCDIRPKALIDILRSNRTDFKHIIV